MKSWIHWSVPLLLSVVFCRVSTVLCCSKSNKRRRISLTLKRVSLRTNKPHDSSLFFFQSFNRWLKGEGSTATTRNRLLDPVTTLVTYYDPSSTDKYILLVWCSAHLRHVYNVFLNSCFLSHFPLLIWQSLDHWLFHSTLQRICNGFINLPRVKSHWLALKVSLSNLFINYYMDPMTIAPLLYFFFFFFFFWFSFLVFIYSTFFFRNYLRPQGQGVLV